MVDLSDTPAGMIARLDEALSRRGETISLHAVNAGVPGEPGITVKAIVRGFKPDQLVNDIRQNDRKVILSPTGLSGAIPALNSKVRIAGKTYNVQVPNPIRVRDVVVRIELQVRG